MWKFKFTIVLIMASLIITIFFTICKYNHIKDLKDSNHIANILSKAEYSGNNEYTNYYFLTENGEMVYITNHVNSKKPSTNEHEKYYGKKVVYLVEDPNVFEIFPIVNATEIIVTRFVGVLIACFVLSYIVFRVSETIWHNIKKHPISYKNNNAVMAQVYSLWS